MVRALLMAAPAMLALTHPAAAQAPGPVSVVYTDGGERTVADWRFIYRYGAGDQPVTSGPYLELTKRTTDLILETVAGPGNGAARTEDRLIPAGDLVGIRYGWGQGAQRDSVTSFDQAVRLRDLDLAQRQSPRRGRQGALRSEARRPVRRG